MGADSTSFSTVQDANAEYVQKLRMSESATDQEIHEALHQLFKTRPQGHSILSNQSPQGSILSKNENTSPQGIESRPTVFLATVISEIQLNNGFKNYLH